ncbi:DNA internalization-related competence protein ComEC/Rec2 [Hafnia alvei]|uniref:Competence protein ComEC n=2 Tax=Hafnia alvei TaxID=569 RepID=A0A1C6Z4S0_HAFAL|nr:DNA internalization-related competence protein ComEC/Rec2 [Hafnia alvei]SCM54200.1 competence protein ComEC [Hafnia alvei]
MTWDEHIHCVALGCLPLMFLPSLPAKYVAYGVLSVALVFFYVCSGRLRKIAFVMLGLAWGIICAESVLAPLDDDISRTVKITGDVVSVTLGVVSPQDKVMFRVSKVNSQNVKDRFNITLYWNSERYPFCAGQRWALTVALRPVHGRLNLGGYDAQRTSVSHHAVLQGMPTAYQRLSSGCDWRQHIISRSIKAIPDSSSKPILVALAFGERALLTREQNSLFRLNGLSHLLAISGLHIALAAMLGWCAARAIQLCFPLRWINPYFPMAMMMGVGWGYVWLAGANPPAIRVGVAMILIAGYGVWGKFIPPKKYLLNVVCLMVVWDPLVLLSDSFWLSVIAVSSLLFWYWLAPLPSSLQIQKRLFWLRLLHLQFGIAVCLMPVQIYLFHGISGSALWANFFSVPLVTYLVVPLILVGIGSCWWNDPLGAWHAAGYLLDMMQWGLSSGPSFWADISTGGLWISLSLLTLFVINFSFSKAGLPLWCAVQAACYLWIFGAKKSDDGDLRVHMLDVGHGLAVLIERRGNAILYDVGNKWDGGDIATSEIIPYLRWHGLVLDGMVISHSDSDHSGGRYSLSHAFPLAWVRSPDPRDFSCHIGSDWVWQGVRFTVLWPPRQIAVPKNNDSCVVMVVVGARKILLTGDIETEAETQLVQRWKKQLKADLLQVPHHGSNTSSSSLLLRTVEPKEAISSSARFSPWHFPSPKVTARYRNQSIHWHDTAHAGEVIMTAKTDNWRISELKTQLNPRWYHGWFGVRSHNE